ncbi:MAG: hypothetical protein N2Z82_01620 [Thermomicrobium sp.]|nr:hypothetical protein [Thermomicrobium sp.]
MRIWAKLAPIATLALLAAAFTAATLAPTDCVCGAELPHPHVLYELPGHHHDHEHGALPGYETDTSTGPRLTLPPSTSSFGNGMPLALLVAWFGIVGWRSERRLLPAPIETPDGRALAPPDPPPRGEGVRKVARFAPGLGLARLLEVGAS